MAVWLVGRLIAWLLDWCIRWLIGALIEWLVGWLIGCAALAGWVALIGGTVGFVVG